MTKTEAKRRMKEIAEIYNTNPNEAEVNFNQLISDLKEENKENIIIELSKMKIGKKLSNMNFDVAFSYKKQGDKVNSAKIYRNIIKEYPNNEAALNNLAIIIEDTDIFEAYKLIERANEIDSEDSIISDNYTRISKLVDDIKIRQMELKNSAEYLEQENPFVITMMTNFINAIKKEGNYSEYQLPIPNWKFKVFMKTKETIAESLKNQWLEKGYIYDTGKRAEMGVKIYELGSVKITVANFDIFHGNL